MVSRAEDTPGSGENSKSPSNELTWSTSKEMGMIVVDLERYEQAFVLAIKVDQT